MHSILQILCDHLFDYAGLFPPAKLPLDTALENYLGYQKHPYRQMLGKFVLPAALSQDAATFLNQKNTQMIHFSILLSPSKVSSNIYDSLYKDIEKINYLIKNKLFLISSFEFSLHLDSFSWEEEKLFSFLDNFTQHLASVKTDSMHIYDLFCEVPFLSYEKMGYFFSLIKRYNSLRSQKISIKLRTGGTTPSSIPTTENLANALILLAQNSITYKATAGLHKPLPNFNPQVNAQMLGYLNVIFASMISLFTNPSHHEKSFSLVSVVHNVIQSLNESHICMREDYVVITIHDLKFEFSKNDFIDFRNNHFKGIGTCEFLEPIDLLLSQFSFEA